MTEEVSMNKYNMINDYYNYENNNYNQPIFNQSNFNNSAMPNNIYDPYNGFIRGNMFPELYNAYKIKNPYEINPMNEQAELLTYIDALTFSVIDLNLFLDIYPDDKNAIGLFNQYRTQLKEYTKQYENKYGPLLLNSDSLESYPWAWNNNPWPWQNK